MELKKVNRFACIYRILILILLSLSIAACATTEAARGPDPDHINAAKRFLHAFNAEELVMIAFERTMESESKKHPESAVEDIRRAMSYVTGEDFLDLITQVYVRHLSIEHLTDLARFAESSTGQRFFQVIISNVIDGNVDNVQDEILSEFKAGELTEIMEFASGNAFQAMNEAQPEINRELSEAARKFSQDKMREYLEQQ